MRPIDADALKEAFEEDGHLSAYIEELIDEQPTISPDDVGAWCIAASANSGEGHRPARVWRGAKREKQEYDTAPRTTFAVAGRG